MLSKIVSYDFFSRQKKFLTNVYSLFERSEFDKLMMHCIFNIDIPLLRFKVVGSQGVPSVVDCKAYL